MNTMIETTPETLVSILARGRERLAAEREEHRRREAAAAQRINAMINDSWNKLEQDVKALLPDFLHPYLNFNRDEKYRLTSWNKDVYIAIPDFAEIEVNMTNGGSPDWKLSNPPFRIAAVIDGGWVDGEGYPPSWSFGKSASSRNELDLALAEAAELGRIFAEKTAEWERQVAEHEAKRRARQERLEQEALARLEARDSQAVAPVTETEPARSVEERLIDALRAFIVDQQEY